MFKKLKEKITEEVKISPQRFVEFTQSVSDRLQNNSTSDDNFFSIGDDDTNTSVDSSSYGFSSVQLVSPQERIRKSSTSSLASDVSFLPKYEPGSMYHLQSDLDISASEVEDNISTASSQLGHLSKEQIYSAFQKSQRQYHKYRGRYTDLSRHYKDLEREIIKMKSVLVETQDKAIRRVTELKEQCSLEQKAKAHLESALRDDIDEKNYKIKTLQTKIGLLQNDHTTTNLMNAEENANNSENLETLTKYLNESRKEIEKLNAKIQELKANAIVFQSKEQEYKSKLSSLEKEIVQFSEREKENNLNLAQNKMELHNEILIKDSEISNLKRETETLKQKLETFEIEGKSNSNQKMENLQSQNTKLIEKVESLTQKSNNLESELIKMQTYKIEIDNYKQKYVELEKQVIDLQKHNDALSNLNSQQIKSLQEQKENYEEQISHLREDAKKGILSLDNKIRQKLEVEFLEREEEIRNEFTAKLQELSSNNTTQELQLQIFEKDSLIKKISEQINETNSELIKKMEAYTDLEQNHLELIENCTKLRDTISNFEKDKLALDSYEEKISRLEAHINTLQEELKTSNNNCKKAEKELDDVKAALVNSSKQIKLLEEQQLQENADGNEIESKLKSLEEVKKQLASENEKLTETIDRQNENIEHLKQNLEDEKEKLNDINEKHSNVVMESEDLKERVRLFELKEDSMNIKKNEVGLLKLKLQELEKTLKLNLESVDKEHESISEDLDSIRKELNLTEEETFINQFNQGGITLKLDALKDMCAKKNKEYNELLLKQSDLVTENVSKLTQVEKLQSEMASILSTNKDFESKIHNLEDSIKKSNSNLEEKEILLNNLTCSLQENQNKLHDLEKVFSLEQDKCSKFSQENVLLVTKLKELEEKYKLLEVNQQKLDTEKSEYNDIQHKLQMIEKDYQHLQNQYEEEKILYDKSAKENKETIDKLKKDYTKANEESKHEKINAESINQKLQQLMETNNKLKAETQEIIATNKKLKNEKEDKEKEISKLSSDIINLSNTIEKQNIEFNNLLTKTNDLDSMLENIRTEKANAITQEKDQQNHLKSKIEELNKKLEQGSKEIIALKEHISQLEISHRDEKEKLEKKLSEYTELESKLKKHNDDLKTKDQEIYILNTERDSLLEEITTLRGSLGQMANEISQKGNIDARLIHSECEKEDLKLRNAKIKEEILELNKRIQELSLDNRNILEENQTLSQEKEELKIALELLKDEPNTGPDLEKLKLDNLTLINTIEDLTAKITELQVQHSKLINERRLSTTNEIDITKIQQDFYEIKEKCDDLFIENKNLKLEYNTLEEKCNRFGKIKDKLETQISDSERHYSELLREKELLADEVQELKTAPVNYKNDISRLDNLETLKKEQSFLKDSEKQLYLSELEVLRDKLTKYKSLDLTNKSSIEFYENELQKMKNQNDKLNRKLDETLVTLNHCAELSTSTEVEYLRNVLFNYMLGKESVVLARVIAAVCKFDPHQTELILQKEQQKQTLLGQLGLI